MKRYRKPSGHCHNGHDQRCHGFIDSEGYLRCRVCRKISNQERSYWRLVSRYMSSGETDQNALEQLQQFHWNEP